jgi:heme/copper-type cytochrome/quinol oxidase subunit 3
MPVESGKDPPTKPGDRPRATPVLAFLGLEARAFADLVARGAGPTRSAFLSAFFTLGGCHG